MGGFNPIALGMGAMNIAQGFGQQRAAKTNLALAQQQAAANVQALETQQRQRAAHQSRELKRAQSAAVARGAGRGTGGGGSHLAIQKSLIEDTATARRSSLANFRNQARQQDISARANLLAKQERVTAARMGLAKTIMKTGGGIAGY